MLSADFVDGVFIGVAATVTGLVVAIVVLIIWSGSTALRAAIQGPKSKVTTFPVAYALPPDDGDVAAAERHPCEA